MRNGPPRGTHRAPGRASINYRDIATPMGRGLGSVAIASAVAATGIALDATPQAAAAPVPNQFGALTPASPTAPVEVPSTVVSYGARGEAVKQVQEKLVASGATIQVDGIFGPSTLRAVRSFQSDANLSVDGVVGKNTWSALLDAKAPASPAASTTSSEAAASAPAQGAQPLLKWGARSTAVRSLQEKLNNYGASLQVDGIFGSGTYRAVRSFQGANGLYVDGVVGKNTWSALDNGKQIVKSTPAPAPEARQAEAPAAPAAETPRLRRGHVSAHVRTLQEKLNNYGASLRVDGAFGSATYRAVRSFQSANSLTVDGIVGPNTWSALENGKQIASNTPAPAPAPAAQAPAPAPRQEAAPAAPAAKQPEDSSIKLGDRGEAVITVQKLLVKNGVSLRVDGSFGATTESAVKDFQRREGLTVDGIVGDSTMKRLEHPTTRAEEKSANRGSERTSAPEGGTNADGLAIVETAKQYIGVPYLWGGNTPSGFDCSGLVRYVYAKHGISMPRVAAQQVYAGKIIPRSEARPGDLVAFTKNGYGHIGIYAGDGMIIDAAYSGRNVVMRKIWRSPHVFVTYRK
ncbi:peptidoglycan-binding protein [Dermabacteraceae bacterium TAE3-ERU27]|nr:peptidoglycan-binding protein [Dermabacteraceae bacterium TAE3-ERU27]